MAPRTPRRILFVTHAYAPDSHAGVEVYTARLASWLQASGRCEVAVVTARLRPGQPQNSVEVSVQQGISVYGLVQNYPYRGLPEALDDAALDRAFAGVMHEFRPDLVAIQSLAGLSLGFVDVSHAAGLPVVLHLHDGWWSCPSGGQRLHPDGSLCLPVRPERCASCFASYQHREGPLERGARALAGKLPAALPPDSLHRAFSLLPARGRGLLQRLNERGARLQDKRADPVSPAGAERLDPTIDQRQRRIQTALSTIDLVLSPTAFLADSLRDDGLRFPKLHIEPTGVPIAHEMPEPAGVDGPLRVLFLGTWVTHKGPQVLARALAALPAALLERRQIHATAVGPAPFPAFQQDVLKLAEGRLHARPALAPHEVPAALHHADLLVVPSLWAENAPLVVLEAFAVGTPVLASDIGGLPELLQSGCGGRLFAAGDHAALATILEQLANRPKELADLAASVQTPRSLDQFASRVEQHYAELCRGAHVQATGS